MMRKREYYRAALNIASRDREWLQKTLAAATKGEIDLHPIHNALIRLALRDTA